MRRAVIRARVTLLPLLGALAASPAVAQRTSAAKPMRGASPACAIADTTASWHQRQRAWLDETRAAWTDTTWRQALLATPASGASATGALMGYEVVGHAPPVAARGDSAMIAQLRTLAATRGSIWPTRSVVGARGVLAVWALAARDTTLARLALKRMMEAGPDESPPAAVAILEDRQRLRAGRKQLYGTQLAPDATGALSPLPIEDTPHLAVRRDGAELPPLAQSLCAARTAQSP